jgi:hypothetical protein
VFLRLNIRASKPSLDIVGLFWCRLHISQRAQLHTS